MRRIKQIIFITSFTLMLSSCHDLKMKSDLIIYNSNIYVQDSMMTNSALVIKEGRILDIGSDNYIRSRYWAPENINAAKAYLYPGFIDAHSHFSGFALNLRYADLTQVKSAQELVDVVVSYSKQHPEGWIVGRGWDQNQWPDKQFPDNEKLNTIFPDRPVVLYRVDGHAVLANNAAIIAAKLPADIPHGEAIIRNNKLTGVFLENTADKIKAAIPAPAADEMAKLLNTAAALCHEAGLTGVTDAGLDADEIDILDSLLDLGQINLRIDAWVTASPENLDCYFSNGPINKSFLRVAAIKLYADGALGSRGACLLKPYSDAVHSTGILVTPVETMKEICNKAYQYNFQVNTHAIGDSAVRTVLRIYSEILKEPNDRRWRIEHSQVVDPADIDRFGKYSIIPSIQGGHATDDAPWAEARLGPYRLKYAYAYHDLLKQNGWLPNGTDFPVISISPIGTFYSSVFRKQPGSIGQNPFQPENALTRAEALKSITIWAAKACFQEKERGTLEKNKLADLVLLDTDLLNDSESKIQSASVLYTIVDGKIRYAKK